MISGFVNLVAV
jgi:hypothetical protein